MKRWNDLASHVPVLLVSLQWKWQRGPVGVAAAGALSLPRDGGGVAVAPPLQGPWTLPTAAMALAAVMTLAGQEQ